MLQEVIRPELVDQFRPLMKAAVQLARAAAVQVEILKVVQAANTVRSPTNLLHLVHFSFLLLNFYLVRSAFNPNPSVVS